MFQTLRACGNTAFLSVFLLSFSSAIPFLLVLGTLHAWLSQIGTSKTTIGLFAFVSTPYALKFLWAPIVDRLSIPVITPLLGQRRSWILTSQIALIFSLGALGMSDPANAIGLTGFLAFLVCICAATQDIGVEAYRVEALSPHVTGLGATASMVGFRLGMWASGGGALYLATYISWSNTYLLMASLVGLGILTTLCTSEPQEAPTPSHTRNIMKKYRDFWREFMDFFKHKDWIWLLPFIFFFKLGDTILNMMSVPFLLETGFNLIEIANIAKTLGVSATILGGLLAGYAISRSSIYSTLLVSAFLELISGILFFWQAKLGHDLEWLTLTMTVESVASGMTITSLIAYFSFLCRKPFTGTFYAILSSFASLDRLGVSALAGWFADRVTWPTYFFMVSLSCLPAIVLLVAWRKRFQAYDAP